MGDELMIPEHEERVIAVQRDPFSKEGKEHILEIWAFRAGRNSAETARILAAELDVHITDRVIRKWVSQEDWESQGNALLEQAAPNIYAGIVTDLLQGAQAGANYIKRAVEGDPSTKVNGRVDMGRVSAANIALQAAGFTPRQMKDAGQLQPPKNATNELAEFADATEANRFWLKEGKQE